MDAETVPYLHGRFSEGADMNVVSFSGDKRTLLELEEKFKSGGPTNKLIRGK